VTERYDDLTAKAAQHSGVVAAGHGGLRRIIPLNFVSATVLPGAVGANDPSITVADVSQFPSSGYVRIGDEIIAYGSVLTGAGWPSLERPLNGNGVGVYPAGAFDTTQSGHVAASLVRHLPVRHVDRYRETEHELYDAAWLDSSMCMFQATYNAGVGADVSYVWWELKEDLEPGQQLIVLVNLDAYDVATNPTGVAWNEDPDDDSDGKDETSGDYLWGTVFTTGSSGKLPLLMPDGSGGYVRPQTQTGNVEVRFYYDLSQTKPYNFSYDSATDTVDDDGWKQMIQLDKVGIEMVPQRAQF
jgi:hypothetical protein